MSAWSDKPSGEIRLTFLKKCDLSHKTKSSCASPLVGKLNKLSVPRREFITSTLSDRPFKSPHRMGDSKVWQSWAWNTMSIHVILSITEEWCTEEPQYPWMVDCDYHDIAGAKKESQYLRFATMYIEILAITLLNGDGIRVKYENTTAPRSPIFPQDIIWGEADRVIIDWVI